MVIFDNLDPSEISFNGKTFLWLNVCCYSSKGGMCVHKSLYSL